MAVSRPRQCPAFEWLSRSRGERGLVQLLNNRRTQENKLEFARHNPDYLHRRPEESTGTLATTCGNQAGQRRFLNGDLVGTYDKNAWMCQAETAG